MFSIVPSSVPDQPTDDCTCYKSSSALVCRADDDPAEYVRGKRETQAVVVKRVSSSGRDGHICSSVSWALLHVASCPPPVHMQQMRASEIKQCWFPLMIASQLLLASVSLTVPHFLLMHSLSLTSLLPQLCQNMRNQ